MAVSRLPRLHQVSGVIEHPSLSSLKTATEVAGAVRMSARRILELSEAQVLPHFRIDGGEPLFNLASLKAYVRQHLVDACAGAPLPMDLRPIVTGPVPTSVPTALAMVGQRLRECPVLETPPCVYFLIEEDAVRYVGQSRDLLARLAQHRHAGRQWERTLFLPVPQSELLCVEAHWIRQLRPPWNRAGLTESVSA